MKTLEDPRLHDIPPRIKTITLLHLLEPKDKMLDSHIVSQPEHKSLHIPARPMTLSYEALSSQEHMFVDSFQLRALTSTATNLCLYVNEKGGYFQLLS